MNNISKNQFYPISELLKDKHFPIADLYNKGLLLNDIDLKLKLKLDPSLREHFEVANINSDHALLLVNSSAWATRLRYNIPTILTVLNNIYDSKTIIKSIRIKIKQPVLTRHTKKNKQLTLSNKSAKFLSDISGSINDPELSECFRKISRHCS